MLFSSVTFILYFLPLVLLGYYCCPSFRIKNGILLFSSLFFYAWGEPVYVLVMIFSILLNYAVGMGLKGSGNSGPLRKGVLAIGVSLNLLLLFVFKYLSFFLEIVNAAFRPAGIPVLPGLRLLMPLGISFYTFQAISYLVDVYRSPSMAQENPLDLGLYIAFFPQLIAGPIVRYHEIREQILRRSHSLEKFSGGIERFIIGLAKKVLLANIMGEFADSVFALPPGTASPYYLCLALLAYSFQIYYDFSGYSGMAVGLGLFFGFSLPENFDYPYASRSVREFWRRWHITLSSWFRDYLYIPLGGNRNGQARTVRNLFIVFLITGLWHGADWNFILWGLGHGLLLFLERIFGERINRRIRDGALKSVLSHVYTIAAVVFLWIFFRLGVEGGIGFLRGLGGGQDPADAVALQILADPRFYLVFTACILSAFPWWRKIPVTRLRFPEILKKAVLLCLLVLSISALISDAYNPFIYFRF
ncbi:MAG: hypothetical protein LBC62_08465 [Treponema sp.]|nr:hypothetical protein [Treponema sp.]